MNATTRDSSRAAAPLKPAADAKTLDTSALSVDQAVEQIIGWFKPGSRLVKKYEM